MFKIKKNLKIINISNQTNNNISIIKPKKQIYFITFGGGGDNYYQAVIRLTNQAKELNIFDKIIGYTDIDLKQDNEFWNKHSEFIKKNKRGYGYWLWKSYLILKTFDLLNENDILIYLDSGCEIDIKKKDNILNCINIIDNAGIVATSTWQIEKKWTKMDLIEYLNMNDEKYTNSIQIQAGAIGIKKTKKNINFINEWYNTGCNYNLINDSKSIKKNYDIFIEHRHDQSIFSLLFKKYNFKNYYDLSTCIEYIRNRGGISKIKNENNN